MTKVELIEVAKKALANKPFPTAEMATNLALTMALTYGVALEVAQDAVEQALFSRL